MRCQIHLTYENRDKSEDVEDPNRPFILRQRFADDSIEVNRTQNCCPGQECALPLLIVVRTVILCDHSLYQRTGEEPYSYDGRHPASKYKPA